MTLAPERRAFVMAGVIGDPIAHSLSPLMHAVWIARSGARGAYAPLRAPDDDALFARALSALARARFTGINVTIPHKARALALADAASGRAREIGAANMLTFKDGAVFADNTDAEGFARALRGAGLQSLRGERALVLGAGGAARAVVHALCGLGAADIIIANRTAARAERLATHFKARMADWSDREEAAEGAGLIVNATSLGMTGAGALDFAFARASRGAIAADIVYDPLETAFLRRAQGAGLRALDGLAMLMGQGAASFEAWFGAPAPIDDALREALVGELARRA